MTCLLSMAGRDHVRALLRHLQTLKVNGSVDSDDDMAFSEVDIDNIPGMLDTKSNVRCRCLSSAANISQMTVSDSVLLKKFKRPLYILDCDSSST